MVCSLVELLSTFVPASSIALDWIFLLNGPFGSGRLDKDNSKVGTGLKYFRISAFLTNATSHGIKL